MVPLPTAPDEELIKLQADVRRADTPVRYARLEHDAACQAVNSRMEEANKLRAALYDLVQSKVQGRALWDAQIASQMAANRAQISAGLVITTRTKLELLENNRHTAQQALDDYVRDPQAYRRAREASERREGAEERNRMASQEEASWAARVAQIREAALKEAKRATATGAESYYRSRPRQKQEERQESEPKKQQNESPKTQPPSPDATAPKAPANEYRRPNISRPLPPLPSLEVTDIDRYRAWYEHTKLVFADYSALTTFPSPPAPKMWCRKLDCANSQAKRELGICHDDIEQAFMNLGLASLKEERLRWHPDRFVRSQDQEKMQRMAKVVFQIVDGLYRRERLGQRA
ncbi:hypothetical protein Slin15195_G083480 [Septoria linicola]|uniref:J domain-containing protein n=1 Tax=Septoria linicola TaxID=215465 RepID=A0A9Q9AUG5_9PEZI|nr:hypothetical protein Slin14017_G085990 [Septoria linicola]USW55029.1 hypothetical protein Slin15195_G083480 [Septoria linicola]